MTAARSFPRGGFPARLHGGFLTKLAAVFALILLGDWMFFQRMLWAGHFGLYGLAMLTAAAAVRPALRRDWRAGFALALAALYALAMAFDAGPLPFALFWLAIGMATLLPATGRFDDGWRWFQRLVFHGFASLFGPLIDWLHCSRLRARRGPSPVGLRAAVPMLALPVIGSAVILWLFAAANPVIEAMLRAVSLPELSGATILRVMLWTLLLWLCWGTLRPRLPRRLLGTFDGRGDLALPGVSPASLLISLAAFNALFALQNAMDLAWLWGLMPLPQDMTLAEYAHRGAYPLIATALLAGLFVLIALRPGSQTVENPTIRALVVVWLAQNVFLVGSSILRTLDYVEAFGLSRLRISALLWMGLVALGLVLIGWRMLRGRNAAWLINANLAALGALLTTLCFVDLGAMAAHYNVAHARETGGKGVELDLCYLAHMDGAPLLALAGLERREGLDPAFRARVSAVRQHVHARLAWDVAEGGWTWRAADRLRRVSVMPFSPGFTRHACNGAAISAEPGYVD